MVLRVVAVLMLKDLIAFCSLWCRHLCVLSPILGFDGQAFTVLMRFQKGFSALYKGYSRGLKQE